MVAFIDAAAAGKGFGNDIWTVFSERFCILIMFLKYQY